eukprot:scpid38244/ scgid32800/ 
MGYVILLVHHLQHSYVEDDGHRRILNGVEALVRLLVAARLPVLHSQIPLVTDGLVVHVVHANRPDTSSASSAVWLLAPFDSTVQHYTDALFSSASCQYWCDSRYSAKTQEDCENVTVRSVFSLFISNKRLLKDPRKPVYLRRVALSYGSA